MTDLAGFSGKDVVKRLELIGYRVVRQRGSHVRLKHRDSSAHKPITDPMHKEIKIGLLSQILKDAGVEITDFVSH